MAKRSQEEVSINMTPMIDVVFQLIIFFIVTATQEQENFNKQIILSQSPHGPAIEKKDPRTIVVEVDAEGRISIAHRRLSEPVLTAILKQAVARYGSGTPVHIRADRKVEHESVRRVMEACGQAGISRISFVAVKAEAPKKEQS